MRASGRERWSRLQISIGDSVFRPEIPAAFLSRRVHVLRLSLSLYPKERASSSPCGYNLSASRSSRHVSRVSSPVAVVLRPNSKARHEKGRDGVRNAHRPTGRQTGVSMQTPSKKSANLKDELFCLLSATPPTQAVGADPIVVHSPSLHTRVFSNESVKTPLITFRCTRANFLFFRAFFAFLSTFPRRPAGARTNSMLISFTRGLRDL